MNNLLKLMPLKLIQDFIFPHICCLCGFPSKRARDLCVICENSLPKARDRCYRCGLLLEQPLEAIICHKCEEVPPKFDRLCALFSYDSPVTRLVTGLKFNQQLAYGRILGEMLSESIRVWYQESSLPEVIIPVPLHPERYRKRGFNQVLEIMRPIQKLHHLPIIDICKRVRRTPPQAGLSQEKRRNNLKHAFQLKAPCSFQHVAIVDDVVTTGSTVNALSEILKHSGVHQVDIWCLCRA